MRVPSCVRAFANPLLSVVARNEEVWPWLGGRRRRGSVAGEQGQVRGAVGEEANPAVCG